MVDEAQQPRGVVIYQPDLKSAQRLAYLFGERGNPLWQAAHTDEVGLLAERHKPGLLVVDLHAPTENWNAWFQRLRQQFPQARLLVTARYPDPVRELAAWQSGARVLLRQPFAGAKLDRAIRTLAPSTGAAPVEAPAPLAAGRRVRLPLRLKIMLPYVLLALVLALAGAYVVTRVVFDSLEERFTNQLIEAGKLASDQMVEAEADLLETQRLLTNIQGMPEAALAGQTGRLRDLALPIAVNYQEDAVEILSTAGESLLSVRRNLDGGAEAYDVSSGDRAFADWDFVQSVLQGQADDQGDKHAGLTQAPWGSFFYVAGPLTDRDGRLVGVVLVGRSLGGLAQQFRQDTLAHITVYDFAGQPLASTFGPAPSSLPQDQAGAVVTQQDNASLTRGFRSGSIDYREIVGPWEARGGQDLGLIGTSLSQSFLLRPSQVTRLQIFLLVASAFTFIIAIGVSLADRITQPLLRVVRASAEVAQGDLDVRVEPKGNDEVAVLADSFNIMVSQLREGHIHRDLLERTVSPEVREQLRQSFASGKVRLDGQTTIATILMSDIHDFTALSERSDPTTVLAWLNEYYGELVPLITAHGGVVNKFDGDAMLAFFGILPNALSPQESAYRACQSALAMLKAIEAINARRAGRGEPPLVTGIGVNTGLVTSGGLGSENRLHYTIIGDTVNTTQRLEKLTHDFGETLVAISQPTHNALDDRASEFHLTPLGTFAVEGKVKQLQVYRLLPNGQSADGQG